MKRIGNFQWAEGARPSGDEHREAIVGKTTSFRSPSIISLHPTPRWDVRIVCEDSQTGEFAAWLLGKILPSTGLNVHCEMRIVNLGIANVIALFQAALLEAAHADFVILSLRGSESMQPGTPQLLRHWGVAHGHICPVAVLLNPTQEFAPGRYEVLTKLEELCADSTLPFFNSLYAALMEAWEQSQNGSHGQAAARKQIAPFGEVTLPRLSARTEKRRARDGESCGRTLRGRRYSRK